MPALCDQFPFLVLSRDLAISAFSAINLRLIAVRNSHSTRHLSVDLGAYLFSPLCICNFWITLIFLETYLRKKNYKFSDFRINLRTIMLSSRFNRVYKFAIPNSAFGRVIVLLLQLNHSYNLMIFLDIVSKEWVH